MLFDGHRDDCGLFRIGVVAEAPCACALEFELPEFSALQDFAAVEGALTALLACAGV